MTRTSLLFVSRTSLLVLCLSVASVVFFVLPNFAEASVLGQNNWPVNISSASPTGIRGNQLFYAGDVTATGTARILEMWVINVNTDDSNMTLALAPLFPLASPKCGATTTKSGIFYGVNRAQPTLVQFELFPLVPNGCDITPTTPTATLDLSVGAGSNYAMMVSGTTTSAYRILTEREISGRASTWIESQAPLDNELIYASSSISVYSTYYVDSSDVQEGETVMACQIWNSVKNLGGLGGIYGSDDRYHGTLCEQVFVFDSEHYILNEIPEIAATGTIQVSHYITAERTQSPAWWQFWESEETKSRTLAEDYSQFNLFAITDDLELDHLLSEYERTQEARVINEATNKGGDYGFLDGWLAFPEDIMKKKHPFAWGAELLTIIQERSQEEHSTSTLEIDIPIFSVVDTNSTSTAIDFSAFNYASTSVEDPTSSPFEDGCEVLNEVLVISTTTPTCTSFRDLTKFIMYIMTIIAVALLMHRLFKEF